MRDPEAVSPFGPSFGAAIACFQRSAPVSRSSAYTLDLVSWMYTVSPETIGLAVTAPKDDPPAPSRKRQRTVSRAMLAASRSVASSARLLDASAFADVHDAAGCEAPHPHAMQTTDKKVATVYVNRRKSATSNRLFE
jgi:hypothetical protein